MIPALDQIKQAIRNHWDPTRTHHARVCDAVLHVKQSQPAIVLMTKTS